jgi:hypothetical protein
MLLIEGGRQYLLEFDIRFESFEVSANISTSLVIFELSQAIVELHGCLKTVFEITYNPSGHDIFFPIHQRRDI